MSRGSNVTIRLRKWLAALCAGSLLAAGLLQGAGSAYGADAGSDDGGLQAVYDQLAAGEKPALNGDYGTLAGPTVFLTFDDGPSTWTPKVLDILKQEGVNGTFFMLGDEAERYPETVKRVLQEGNAIGNHTYDHVYSKLYGGFDTFWDQVQQTEGILEPLVGEKPAMVRAPGGTAGNFDAFYYYELQQAGYTVFDWNIDSGDSERAGVPAQEIIDTVRKGPFLDETIVLMHDGGGHGETVKALPAIIQLFKEKGYAFATLSPKVPPIQFSLRKVRWSRSMSFDAFKAATAKAREHAAAMKPAGVADGEQAAGDGAGGGEADAAGNGGGAVGSGSDAAGSGTTGGGDATVAGGGATGGGGAGGSGSGAAGSGDTTAVGSDGAARPSGEPVLNVSVDGRSWSIQPHDYEFRQGRFAVSLNGLVSQLGGKVAHEDGTTRYRADVGAFSIEYDFSKLEERVYQAGSLTMTIHLADAKPLPGGDVLVPLRQVTELLGGRIDGYTISSGARLVSITSNVRVSLPTIPVFSVGDRLAA